MTSAPQECGLAERGHDLEFHTASFPARYALVDIARGLAALSVVAFHAVTDLLPHGADTAWGTVAWPLWVLSRGAFGVTLFFVLSGYCISVTAHSTLQRQHGLWTFAVRRARRIYPPFWASVVLIAIVSAFLAAIGRQDLMRWDSMTDPFALRPFEVATNLTLTHTWLPGVLHTGTRTVNGVSWSLCYEEQFYVVCGLAAGLAAARRVPGTLFVVLGLLSAIIAIFVVQRSGGELVSGTFLGPKWLQFALGGLVYYRLAVATGWRAAAADVVLSGFVMVLTVALIIHPSLQWQNPVTQLWIAACLASTLRWLRPFDDSLRQFLTRLSLWIPLHRLGQMTYSVYLVHAPVVMIVTGFALTQGPISVAAWLSVVVPLAILASLLSAWVFYQLVERHCLNRPVPSQMRPGSRVPDAA